MKKAAMLLVGAILVTGFFWAGCRPLGGPKTGSGADIRLCAKCGQIKGSAACCKPGATTCATCGLAKGSPGCCKIKKSQ